MISLRRRLNVRGSRCSVTTCASTATPRRAMSAPSRTRLVNRRRPSAASRPSSAPAPAPSVRYSHGRGETAAVGSVGSPMTWPGSTGVVCRSVSRVDRAVSWAASTLAEFRRTASSGEFAGSRASCAFSTAACWYVSEMRVVSAVTWSWIAAWAVSARLVRYTAATARAPACAAAGLARPYRDEQNRRALERLDRGRGGEVLCGPSDAAGGVGRGPGRLGELRLGRQDRRGRADLLHQDGRGGRVDRPGRGERDGRSGEPDPDPEDDPDAHCPPLSRARRVHVCAGLPDKG